MVGISRRLNFSESRNSLASSDEQLSSRTINLTSDTFSPEGRVGSGSGSASSSNIALSHSNSNSKLSTNSSDTASTASLHDSDIMDDPRNTWENLGLVELEIPVRPRHHTQHGREHPVLLEHPKDLVFLWLPHTGDRFGLESAAPPLRICHVKV